MSIDFTTFDADNHYYEATDAFTRYLDKGMARRTMQWAEVDGRQRLLVAGAINRFIPNPTFDPVAKPGSLDEYFRGHNPRGDNIATLFGDLEPIRPEYRDRDARLAVMDAQGIDGCFLFPTLGVGMEEALGDDPEAAVAAFHAFNRWLDDDWGYAYQERIFAAPMIPLVDVDAAVAELEEVLAKDARIVCIKSGPALTADGRVSPGDARFDPFWARVNEAGVTVGIHSGDAGYNRYVDDWEQVGRVPGVRLLAAADRPQRQPGALRDHGRPGLPGGVRPVPQGAGGQHRGRRRLGPRPPEEAEEGLRPEPEGLRLGSGADVPRPHLGGPLLRGRSRSAEGPGRPRPPPVRLRLAPRRRAGRAPDLRRRPPSERVRRGRDPDRHVRQRPGRWPERLP